MMINPYSHLHGPEQSMSVYIANTWLPRRIVSGSWALRSTALHLKSSVMSGADKAGRYSGSKEVRSHTSAASLGVAALRERLLGTLTGNSTESSTCSTSIIHYHLL